MSVSQRKATSQRKAAIGDARSVVVKVGTRVLTTANGRLDRRRIAVLAAGLCQIAESGKQTVLVSSGAVGAGMAKLNLDRRPTGIATLQAVAAIGQANLIQTYQRSFAAHRRVAAQVLLTAEDLHRRSGYLHVRNALGQIHQLGAIAIVNENDSVAVEELSNTFGDNDRLAAQVAGLLSESLLIILSDVDGLHDGPPGRAGSKKLDFVAEIDDTVMAMVHDRSGSVSKGGMASKLAAAAVATSHGHPTIIAPGHRDGVLESVLAGEPVGTFFAATTRSEVRGRRRWIGASARVDGALRVDAGAAKALVAGESSLLAIGIIAVEGDFAAGDVVSIVDPLGVEIARGLSNYPSTNIATIIGRASDEISEVLGYCPHDSVVHRDNLVLQP